MSVETLTLTRETAQASGLPPEIIPQIFAGKAGDILSLPNRTGEVFLIVNLLTVEPLAGEELELVKNAAAAEIAARLDADLQNAFGTELASAAKVRRNDAAYDRFKASLSQDQ